MTDPHDQEERLLHRAEASARRVERRVQGMWRQLLATIGEQQPWPLLLQRLTAVLKSLPEIAGQVGQDLQAEAHRSYTQVQTSTPRRVRESDISFTVAVLNEVLPDLLPEVAQTLVYSSGWQRRLATLTRLGSPEALAATIATAIANGATPRQAASLIQPLVQDVQSTAMRVARHETIRVAHEARLLSYESLGPDLVIGYQVHAVLDERTRPEHRRRDGHRYYRNPTVRQRGFDKMPRPPMEANGTVAFNCRCYLTPILDE